MSIKHVQLISESVISRLLILLSASGVASKPLSLYAGPTLDINSDDLQVTVSYTHLTLPTNREV